MKLKRRKPPETVWRPLVFPVYLILAVEAGKEGPTPMLSLRDGRYGCHVEFTMDEAMATVRELSKLRVRHRDRFPTVIGSAVIEVRSPEELWDFANSVTPTPEGFFYQVRVDLRRDWWEAVFVAWEKMHAYQRAMG